MPRLPESFFPPPSFPSAQSLRAAFHSPSERCKQQPPAPRTLILHADSFQYLKNPSLLKSCTPQPPRPVVQNKKLCELKGRGSLHPQIPQIALVSPGCCLLLGPALLASDKAAAAPSSRSRQWAALSQPSQPGYPIAPLAPRSPSILFPGRSAGRVPGPPTPPRPRLFSLLSTPPSSTSLLYHPSLSPRTCRCCVFSLLHSCFFPSPCNFPFDVLSRSLFSLSLLHVNFFPPPPYFSPTPTLLSLLFGPFSFLHRSLAVSLSLSSSLTRRRFLN